MYCFLHLHAVTSLTLPTDVKDMMTTAIRVINFIRAQTLHHRLFKVSSQEIRAEHEVHLSYTGVRYLSNRTNYETFI